jgi:proteasome lid subunit RPN8/RPN11
MIQVEAGAWRDMVSHAEATYPNECCGVMLGSVDDVKIVRRAVVLENVAEGSQRARYELSPEDLIRANRAAREQGLDLIGIYHSHPDADAYFSKTDLENSYPWYSFVVLSVRSGRFDHANSWLPDLERTKAEKEELTWQNS